MRNNSLGRKQKTYGSVVPVVVLSGLIAMDVKVHPAAALPLFFFGLDDRQRHIPTKRECVVWARADGPFFQFPTNGNSENTI
jgi:hypothetical protein